MKRTYAVVWSEGGDVVSGRLDRLGDGFELHGRDRRLSIPFSELVGAAIARGRSDRLRGLPVLALDIGTGAPVRIASLEGTAVLHELADRVAAAGLNVAEA
jgi:hypothetical protein